MKESIIFYSVKILGAIVRAFPLKASLFLGKVIGFFSYVFDVKHKTQVYNNLRTAFSSTKSPEELDRIAKRFFINFGQNLVELLRMPLLSPSKYDEVVDVSGKENVEEALKLGKGVILLAMHYGSWEIASLSCAMLGFPYKMLVKSQPKYSRIDELLNSFRTCGGSVVLTRGMGTRDMIKSLKNNEVIGMVADQGGRDGVAVPFLGKEATMSVGAIRLGLKLGVPICFVSITRGVSGKHHMVIEKPFVLENSGNIDNDVRVNITKVVSRMEHYINEEPSEYMWFYKIWKYTKEMNVLVLNDGKTGHLRQSQNVAEQLSLALSERDLSALISEASVEYRSNIAYKILTLLSVAFPSLFARGRLSILRSFLSEKSYKEVLSTKPDFVISCGSRAAVINIIISHDCKAKSITILKPSILSLSRFNKVILPRHDVKFNSNFKNNIVVTSAAPNIINKEYLDSEAEKLLLRYSHLKDRVRTKIGVFIGGDSKNIFISEDQVKLLVNQLKEVSKEIKADILLSTSRRTPRNIESILVKGLKKMPNCPLLIVANKENIPEAVGGILGLSDVVVVSGDSISMISEAINAGKKTVVFSVKEKPHFLSRRNKHKDFIDNLNLNGFIMSTHVKDLGRVIYDMTKNKLYTKQLNDNAVIFEAMKKVI